MPVKARPLPPPPPIYSWTGFYVGVNGGYGWGDTSASIAALDPASAGFIDFVGRDQFASSFRQRGGIFGGQIGYRSRNREHYSICRATAVPPLFGRKPYDPHHIGCMQPLFWFWLSALGTGSIPRYRNFEADRNNPTRTVHP